MTAGAQRICLAFDSTDRVAIESTATAVRDHVGVFKIGPTAFTAHGPALVRALSELRPVFLDLKLHDIPVQVAGAVEAIAAMRTSYTTVHAAGGTAMLAAAAQAAGETTVLAVTLLTSLGPEDATAIGFGGTPRDIVTRLAALAIDAGADGVVCSAHEVRDLRARHGSSPVLVVPGIRTGRSDDDQSRTGSARAAIDAGADLIVVGRPITAAKDPVAAARALSQELA